MLSIHRILVSAALCFTAVGLSSCRLALHTLPDYVGKKEFGFYDAAKPGYEVYRCEDILYVKLPGYYKRPRAAVFDSYNFKDGDWGNVFGSSLTDRSHESEITLYFPLDQELVSMWNKVNAEKPLSFARYQSGGLTEEQMKEKQGKLIAHGSMDSGLKTAICEAATQKSYAHYALRPIAIPLEMVDAASTIPLSTAAGATALVVGVPAALIYEAGRQMQDAPLPAPENKPSEME